MLYDDSPGEPLPKTLREAVQQRRNNLGLSCRQLSGLVGCSSAYIARFERGEIEPSAQVFARLCRVLGFSGAEILFLVSLLSVDSNPAPRLVVTPPA